MRGEMQDGRSRPWRAWLIGGGAAGVAAVVALVLVLRSPPPAPSKPPAQAPVASQPGPAPEPLPTPQGPVSASRAPASAVPLSVDRERALKPKDTFSECANCPEMMVVPAGSFTMGSPSGEEGRRNDESPQHRVTFDRPFAVGKFAVTFDEWDACAADGGCGGYRPADQGWGRRRRLAINVSWEDAKSYVAWLSKKTGKSYRLLTEAEYEYATRAGTETTYPWGAEIGKGNANCNGCGSQWDGNQTAPVGSFAPNRFGLYDMVGNLWEWVEDCVHPSYSDAPTDGSAWTVGNCTVRVIRGGSWYSTPGFLRSADRNWVTSDDRGDNLGFRVGRTLTP
jgi:formylglycine-generating enzyme required for sulfatase activity